MGEARFCPGEGSEAGYPFSNYSVVNTLRLEAEAHGVGVYYETPAVQLVKDKGRVAGVVCVA